MKTTFQLVEAEQLSLPKTLNSSSPLWNQLKKSNLCTFSKMDLSGTTDLMKFWPTRTVNGSRKIVTIIMMLKQTSAKNGDHACKLVEKEFLSLTRMIMYSPSIPIVVRFKRMIHQDKSDINLVFTITLGTNLCT